MNSEPLSPRRIADSGSEANQGVPGESRRNETDVRKRDHCIRSGIGVARILIRSCRLQAGADGRCKGIRRTSPRGFRSGAGGGRIMAPPHRTPGLAAAANRYRSCRRPATSRSSPALASWSNAGRHIQVPVPRGDMETGTAPSAKRPDHGPGHSAVSLAAGAGSGSEGAVELGGSAFRALSAPCLSRPSVHRSNACRLLAVPAVSDPSTARATCIETLIPLASRPRSVLSGALPRTPPARGDARAALSGDGKEAMFNKGRAALTAPRCQGEGK